MKKLMENVIYLVFILFALLGALFALWGASYLLRAIINVWR